MIYRHTHRMYSSGIFIVYPYRTVNLLRLASDLFVTSTLVVIKMNVVVFEPSVFYSLPSLPQLLPHLLSPSLSVSFCICPIFAQCCITLCVQL